MDSINATMNRKPISEAIKWIQGGQLEENLPLLLAQHRQELQGLCRADHDIDFRGRAGVMPGPKLADHVPQDV